MAMNPLQKLGAAAAILASSFAAAVPALAQDTASPAPASTVVMVNSIETDPGYLKQISADRLVLHYNPAVLAIDSELRRFERDHYKVTAVPDVRIEGHIVNAYMNGKGPKVYSEDQVLGGEFSSELRGAYDIIFGSPSQRVAALEAELSAN